MLKVNSQYIIGLFLIVNLCVFYSFFAQNIFAEENGKNIFTTWEGFEVDKCASIWLITRFIDKNAIIKIIPKGAISTDGVLFDIPEAKFRRTFNRSTYESLQQYYKLSDPKLIKIGKIVHDVEINTWDKKKYAESRNALEIIHSVIMKTKDSSEILKISNQYFDMLYEKIDVKDITH